MNVARQLITVIIFGLALVAAAWSSDPVSERGLSHSTDGRDMVEESIARVAIIVGSDGPRLAPSWNLPGEAAGEVIPVYLVEAKPGTPSTPAAVPRDCRCVFVSPAVLQEWVKHHSTGTGRLDLDNGELLVFMLLHEVGHLKNGTPGAVFRNGELSQLNVEPSRAKAAEEDADNFAADILKKRATQPNINDISLDANMILLELSALGWNMQAYRTLDEFGASLIGTPSVYFDSGYSHPNLAWRILQVNDRVHNTEETRALLQAFEASRQLGINPEPLYIKPEE
jgi:hypothetical protein